ncbi:MAG: hypothetical protein LBG69_01610 [Zoogloeaceae bacterium]|jgi:hypothetical protein|nr:hypothetical protein [Zoogloeaceae bacterium]
MARINYTRGYDLIFQWVSIFGAIFICTAVVDIIDPISTPLEHWLEKNGFKWIWVILMWVYIIGGYISSVALITGKLFWLPAFMYARWTLSTKITANEARRLSFLFDGTLGGSWYPLKQIKGLPPKVRRVALFRFADKIADKHGLTRPFNLS